jgi:dTDP-4-dehydrorhamnose reductase
LKEVVLKKTKVLVLGATGMLGSMVTDLLSRDENLDVAATARSPDLAAQASERIGNTQWQVFEVEDEADTLKQFQGMNKPAWIINAIGIIKPYARDDKAEEIEQAIRVNALFPHWLARAFQQSRILQIATDCVYSGSKGSYVETDKHDALDVYGKTKSLGEVVQANANHLRCSIIGPEPKSYVSLLEWFCRQPANAKLNGFVNHSWNGVTTLHFAKICHGIIRHGTVLPCLQHVLAGADITKHQLLCCFARCYGRSDIEIAAVNAATAIDRRLATENRELNNELWSNAGYPDGPPSVEEMVEEMAAFEYRFKDLAV